jgi:exodeoxyribonuclease-3
MRIATWNVNSIRVRVHAVLAWLSKHQPDVLCVQETKVEDEKFPAREFSDAGYRSALCGQKTYNGVAVLSRHAIEEVRPGFPDLPVDEQRRLMAATVGGIRIINAYIPNGQTVDSPKFIYKLGFIARLRTYLDRCHRPDEPLAVLGDFNVAPEPRDVHAPEQWEEEVLFHPEARTAILGLKAWGLIDLFRMHHGKAGHFSWWDYRVGAFRRNLGLRIDHIWATPVLADRCTACEIDKTPRGEEKPSDHVPVIASFDDTYE